MTEGEPAAPVAHAASERTGAQTLALLATPLNVRLLRAHTDGAHRLPEVQERIGWPPQSTLRVAIQTLRGVGALARRQLPGAPYAVVNQLTPAGEELLGVADLLEAWLAQAPDGSIDVESSTAKAAIKALAQGWSSSIIKILATEPATLSDLDRSISEASYPSLERRLTRMRVTNQIEGGTRTNRGTPFQVTDWLRRSAGALCGAARWEQRHLPAQPAGIASGDIETVLLLAVPLLLPLPAHATGQCFLGVSEVTAGAETTLAGLMVDVREGRVVSSTPELNPHPVTWALGTPESWLDAVLDGDLGALRLGGADPQLATNVCEAIHLGLYKGRSS
jgi:DNA-binding HxlR family transcriptional regulator